MNEIKLSQVSKFKSVDAIGAVELPLLTVLAGVNGAGKSHLLQAIKAGAVRAYSGEEVIETADVALYDWTDFAAKPPPTANTWEISQRRDALWRQICAHLKSGKANQRIEGHGDRLKRTFTREDLLRTPVGNLGLPDDLASRLDQERRAVRTDLLDALAGQRQIIKSVEKLTGKLIVELSREEFAAAAEMTVESSDPLQFRVSELFLAYRSALDRNDLLRLKSQQEDEDFEYLDAGGFISKYGPPPWDVLNGLLADLNLDFEVDHPQVTQDSYDVSLIQSTSKTPVAFTDLSSGEKVLMALAVSLYGSGETRHGIKLPKIMLLDEIDAPLHPDMTRMYFRVIDQLLLQQGVGVIMATHNPSTVALAPEGSIRRMSKTIPRITTVTRQQALTDLTAGVTALTVRFDERRVVFVEANADADAYTAVLDALRSHLDMEYGLAFLSVGLRPGHGGADVVRDHVKRLRQSGANSIYGLIDRDKGNTPEPDGSVVVLGQPGRYTIENYLLDPILLAALATREKLAGKIAGLDELLGDMPGTWRGLNLADERRLQPIVDYMLSQICPGDNAEIPCVTSGLVGGPAVKLPQWFVDLPGHKLAEKWLDGIPVFKRYRDEQGLRKAVVSLVVPDVPQLLARDFLDAMAALAGDAR